MYKLFLVNHTQYEYYELCRSNFSQERVPFVYPPGWDWKDDAEIMTEFVFREKLKHRKRYSLVETYPQDLDEDDPESGQEDLAEPKRKETIKSKQSGPETKLNELAIIVHEDETGDAIVSEEVEEDDEVTED